MRKNVFRLLGGFLVLAVLFTLLSRAADSTGIPRIQTAKMQGMTISHQVTAQGKVEQKREQAVLTEPNQVVKAIYVDVGQQVEKGELLFELDMEELEEQILDAKRELQKSDLQNGDGQSARSVAAQQKSLEQQQAADSYADAETEGNREVEKAKKELEEAKKALESREKPTLRNETGEQEEELKEILKQKEEALQQAAQNRQEIEKKANAQEEEGAYQAELADAKAVEEAAQKEKESAEQALKEYQKKSGAKKETEAKETKEQLRQAVEEKREAYEAAVEARDKALRDATRAVSSASIPAARDSSSEIAGIEREQKELELKKLEKIKKQEGKVLSPIKGVVTKVTLTTGDRTPDGTAILLADLTAGSRFVAQIPAEQEKYIARKDAVKLATEGSKKEIENLEVTALSRSEENQELLDVTVDLPPDALEIGTAASMETVSKPNTQPCAVPLSALYYDNNQAYVLVVEETETVLGTERIARRVDVTVLDKNEEYAALQEGTLTAEQDIITGADRNVEPGGRVRLEEP